MLSETHTAIDALHANGVLLVAEKFAENVEQLSLTHLWNKLNHFFEAYGGLFTHLRSRVFGNLTIHGHENLLVFGQNFRVRADLRVNGRDQ